MRRAPGTMAVAVLVLATVTACGNDDRPASACRPVRESTALPPWATAGFSDPQEPQLHTTGRSGRIVGVLFGDPYVVPPRPDRNNKILWVPRDPAGGTTLTIHATRAGSSQSAIRRVPLGPSAVDMPAAGCWRMELSWGATGHRLHDRVDVRYTARD